MKIAQVTPVFPPRGGMGTVAKEYTDALRERGDDVSVFTPSYTRGLFWGNAALMPNVLWRLRGFDVIHLHYPFYGGACFTALASLLWRTPLVVTYHMQTKANGWLGVVFRVHRALIESFILWCASAVLVSSHDYAQSVQLKATHELPFGVATKRFYPGTKSDSFTILFVGGMDDAHYFKGVDVLLRAVAELDVLVRLVLVGDGNLRLEYEALAGELGIAERVHFAGRVSDDDLPALYRSAHVHVLPSIDRSEAFGLVTLEAAASGTASVVSDLPGVRTLVVPRETGFHVPPGDISALADALRLLSTDQERVHNMGKMAYIRVKNEYERGIVVDRLQGVYREVRVKKNEDA